MPTVINLKDLTPSDGSGAIVEKINFNFNQILSLGVGSQGPVGPQGSLGPAGPIGLTGVTGQRGSHWYTYNDIDVNNPTLSPIDLGFTPPIDLLIGDLYTDSLFNVWEYRIISNVNTWVKVIDSNTLFSNFLISNGAEFKRNFTASSGNANEERFITFNQTNGSDRSFTGSTGYYNDALFMHNFDQTQLGAEFVGANVKQFYTALQSIFVDHYSSSDDLQVRHHLQLGSVYNNGSGRAITKNNENLKIKFKIEGGTRISIFNASKNDGDSASDLGTFNSAFKFNISKFDSAHTTLTYALASAQTIRQFTDATFIQIDGLSLTRDQSKIAFGIENNGTRLAIIGNTGIGAITEIYSNLPLGAFGGISTETQFTGNISMLGSGAKEIKAVAGLTLSSTVSSLILAPITGLATSSADAAATVSLRAAGKVGVGVKKISAVTNSLQQTSTDTPTANLMVNGSFAVGMRRITTGAIPGDMVLAQTDMTVFMDDVASGTNWFNLGISDGTNATRLVVLVNNSSNPIDIKAGTPIIGTISAKNTAIYQSFGSAWFLLISAPNQLSNGSGSGAQTTYIKMAITNVRSTITNNPTSTSLQQTGDLVFYFYSDANGTIAIPAPPLEVRVRKEVKIVNTSFGVDPVSDPPAWIFAQSFPQGGSPQAMFPGIETMFSTYPNTASPSNYVRTSTYFLCDKNSPPLTVALTTTDQSKESDGTTTLKYVKV